MSTFSNIEYPYFRKGQVLKNTDLNNLVEYLDDQNRITRVLTAGTGIFTGLEYDILSEKPNGAQDDNYPYPRVVVEQGFGFSSDGYIIEMDNDVYHYPYFRKITLSPSKFANLNIADVSCEAIELLPGDFSEDKTELSGLFEKENIDGQMVYPYVGNYCLILWVSIDEEDRPFCINACEESGADLLYQIKPLLIKKSDLEALIDKNSNTSSFNNTAVTPKFITIPQFGYTTNNDAGVPIVNPSLVTDFDKFIGNYREIIQKVLNSSDDIVAAFNWAYQRMVELGLEQNQGNNVFSYLKSNIENVLNKFQNPILQPDGSEDIEIQYLYLYLHDLKRAYEEFIATYCSVNQSIVPDRKRHPRHVGLGGVAVEETRLTVVGSDCRTLFQSSWLNGNGNSLIKEIKLLYKRMVELSTLKNSDPNGRLLLPLLREHDPNIQHIRVTPGAGNTLPLSKQSIPFYYDSAVRDCWSAKETNCFEMKLFGYRLSNTSEKFPSDTPLLSQDPDFNFFRIEGHVGKKTKETVDTLKTWKEYYNLPFDIKSVFLDSWNYGDPPYDSIELKILQEKYFDVKSILIEIIESISEDDQITVPLPDKLEDFNCSEFKQWFDVEIKSEDNAAECSIHKLESLRLLYDLEQREQRNLSSFSEFANANKGLQHLGGVSKGGTFVVVSAYANQEDVNEKIAGFDREIVKEIISIEKNNSSNANIEDLKFKRKNLVEEKTASVIVGDFALPYITSDNEIGIEPLIVIAPAKFCSADKGEYEIWTYPKGGVLKSSLGSIFDANGEPTSPYVKFDKEFSKFTFIPSEVNLATETKLEIIFSYALGGLTSKAKVTVFAHPDEIEPGIAIAYSNVTPQYDANKKLSGYRVRVSAVNVDSFDHAWYIDGNPIDEPKATFIDETRTSFEQDFMFEGGINYGIDLVVKNGVCQTRKDSIINLCELLGQVSLQFNGTAHFSEQPEIMESLLLNVTPLGGEFVILNEEGEELDIEDHIEEKLDDNNNVQYSLVNYPEGAVVNGDMKESFHSGMHLLKYRFPVCGKVAIHQFNVNDDTDILMERYEFCEHETGRFPVNYFPKEAVLTSTPADLLEEDEGVYYFRPSSVEMGNVNEVVVTLKCTYSGTNEVSKTITVYRLPDAIEQKEGTEIYNQTNCRLTGYTYAMNPNLGATADSYKWLLNGNEYSQGAVANVNIPLGQSDSNIQLIITKQLNTAVAGQTFACTKTLNTVIVNTCSLIDPSVSVESENDSKFKIKIEPSGGRLSLYRERDNALIIDDLFETVAEGTNCAYLNTREIIWEDLKKKNDDIKEGVDYFVRYSFDACNKYSDSNPFRMRMEDASIQITPNVFCSNDKGSYTIDYSPNDATLEILSTDPSGAYGGNISESVFKPSAITSFNDNGKASVTIQCKVSETNVATTTVTVCKLPDTIFEVGREAICSDGSLDGYVITLSPGNGVEADFYEWNNLPEGNENVNRNEKTIEIFFPLGHNNQTVRLEMTKTIIESSQNNEPVVCSNKLEYVLVNACDAIDPKFVRLNEMDEGDQVMYELEATPAGGTFSLYERNDEGDMLISDNVFEDFNFGVPCDQLTVRRFPAIALREVVTQLYEYNNYYFTYEFKPCDKKATSEVFVFHTKINGSGELNVPQLMRQRAAQRNSELSDMIEEDSTLNGLQTVETVKNFLINPGDIEKIRDDYQKLSNSLFTRIKQSTEKRFEQFTAMFRIVTQAFLDKIVDDSPSTLSLESTNAIIRLANKMKENGIARNIVFTTWKEEIMKQAFGSGAIGQINGIFDKYE